MSPSSIRERCCCTRHSATHIIFRSSCSQSLLYAKKSACPVSHSKVWWHSSDSISYSDCSSWGGQESKRRKEKCSPYRDCSDPQSWVFWKAGHVMHNYELPSESHLRMNTLLNPLVQLEIGRRIQGTISTYHSQTFQCPAKRWLYLWPVCQLQNGGDPAYILSFYDKTRVVVNTIISEPSFSSEHFRTKSSKYAFVL